MILINDNIKQYYRFIEFVSKLLGIDLPHERFKLIALNKYKVESKEEREVSSLKDAYLYLLNNSSQVLTRQLLINTYYLLTNKFLNSEIVDQLIEEYYKNIDDPVIELVSKVHLRTLNKVNERKIEFAFILSNYILFKNKEKLLIPYEWNFKDYKEACELLSKDRVLISILEMQSHSKDTNDKKDISFNEIVSKLKEKEEVLKKRFLVKGLYLYGSLTKGSNYDQSDLDLLVIFNDKLINMQKEKLKEELQKYLSNELDVRTDLIDFMHALNNLDISEMENIISIIKEEK